MQKITINLLPDEFITEKKLRAKRVLLLRISIIVLICGLILTSGVLLIRLSQSQSLQGIENDLMTEKNVLNQLSESETTVNSLKTRLDKINKLAAKKSVQVEAYDLINSILPTGVILHNFSMTKENKISISVETTSTSVLSQLFDSLLDPKSNQEQITGVSLENIRLQTDKITAEIVLDYSPNDKASGKAKS